MMTRATQSGHNGQGVLLGCRRFCIRHENA
jgi:hypothetical protein